MAQDGQNVDENNVKVHEKTNIYVAVLSNKDGVEENIFRNQGSIYFGLEAGDTDGVIYIQV